MATIILVDDHLAVRQRLHRILAAEPGLQVVAEAAGCDEALAAAALYRPEVVVTDLRMGCCSGLGLVTQLRRQFGAGPIILVLSLNSEAAYVDSLFERGANGFLVKDRAAEQLVPTLRRLLQGRPVGPGPKPVLADAGCRL